MSVRYLLVGLGMIAFCAMWKTSAYAENSKISAENWTQAVAFQPDSEAESLVGQSVDKASINGFQKWIPSGLKLLVEKYGLKFKVRGYEPVHPSSGYIAATNKHRGSVKIVGNDKDYSKPGLTGYGAGLPFPRPQTGLEVAWNHFHSYRGDDGEVYYSVYWVSARAGVEHTEEWRLSWIRAAGRTDVSPTPAIEEMTDKGLQGAGLTYALAPYDKKGFGAVYFSSIEPKDSQGHVYVPAMRRILRNSFGTRGDSWNSTDLLYEDVRGYSGYPEWMNWKLVARKTILLPMHSGVKLGKNTAEKTYDFKKTPHWNPRYAFEPRPTYVVEAKPKLKDYPYSRQLFYIDAETFAILYKESFDKKGALWKVMLNCAGEHQDAQTDASLLGWSGTVVIDLQAEHATVFHVHKAQVNLDLSPNQFSLSTLRKRGR